MKITKTELRKIIKEELEAVLHEDEAPSEEKVPSAAFKRLAAAFKSVKDKVGRDDPDPRWPVSSFTDRGKYGFDTTPRNSWELWNEVAEDYEYGINEDDPELADEMLDNAREYVSRKDRVASRSFIKVVEDVYGEDSDLAVELNSAYDAVEELLGKIKQ